MSRVHYKQIDLTQKDKEKLYLQKLQSQGYFIIGIEVFDKDISQLCHLNFDPQHSDGNYKNTALETVFNIKFDLKEIAYDFFDVLLITIKSDLDSISSTLKRLIRILVYREHKKTPIDREFLKINDFRLEESIHEKLTFQLLHDPPHLGSVFSSFDIFLKK